MEVTTYEATVENGQIKLADGVRLPEHTLVYVVVPGRVVGQERRHRIASPRLAKPEEAAHFVMEVSMEHQDDVL